MTSDLNPKVTGVQEVVTLTGQGAVLPQVRVTFTVGAHGPFTITLPRAEFSAAAVRAEMEKLAVPLRELNIGG
jgi:hypothetical protein